MAEASIPSETSGDTSPRSRKSMGESMATVKREDSGYEDFDKEDGMPRGFQTSSGFDFNGLTRHSGYDELDKADKDYGVSGGFQTSNDSDFDGLTQQQLYRPGVNPKNAESISEINGIISRIETASLNDESAPDLKEKTVNDLSLQQREKLHGPLDMTLFSYPNWYLLGCEVYKQNDVRKKRLQDLHECYCGGGSKGLRFLERLEYKKTVTCLEFAKIAKELQRNDIYEKLEKQTGNLKDLENDQKLELATMLNSNYRGWDYFAEKCGFNNNERRQIKQAVKEDNVYSPTERLLEWFDVDKITLGDLKTACEERQFKNVIKIITEIEMQLNRVDK